eukprot:m51a1_g7856 hypothetical protein (208) ;mRNA; r:243627-248509
MEKLLEELRARQRAAGGRGGASSGEGAAAAEGTADEGATGATGAVRVAVVPGCFNPPTVAHQEVVRALGRHYDRVVVLPCGPRADRPAATQFTPPVHRAAMLDLAFRSLCAPASNALLDLADLEGGLWTPAARICAAFAEAGALATIAVGADVLERQRMGASEVQRAWPGGRDLWESADWAVFERPGYVLEHDALPPHCRVFPPREQ